MPDGNQKRNGINRRNVLKSIALLGSTGTAGLSIGRVSGEAVTTSSTTYRNYLDQLHSEHGEIVDTSTVLNPTTGSGGASISTNKIICPTYCDGGGDDGGSGGGDGGGDGGGGDDGGSGGGGGTVDPNDPPVADATGGASTIYVGEQVNFSSQGSYDSDGSIRSYSWDFGDGTSATGSSVTHTYESPGVYSASVTVEDYDGAEDRDSVQIRATYGYRISVTYEDGHKEDFRVYLVGNKKLMVEASNLRQTVTLDNTLVSSLQEEFNSVKNHSIVLPNPETEITNIGDKGDVTVFGENDFQSGSHSLDLSALKDIPIAGMGQTGFAGWSEGGRIEAGAAVTLAGGVNAVSESFIDKTFRGDTIRTTTISIDGSYLTAFWLLFGSAYSEIELFCRQKADSGWVYENRKTIHEREHTVEDAIDMVSDPLSNLHKVNPIGEIKSGSLEGSEISADISPGDRCQIGIRAKCVSSAFGKSLKYLPNIAATSMLSTNTDLNHKEGGLKNNYSIKSDLPLFDEYEGHVKMDSLSISWDT